MGLGLAGIAFTLYAGPSILYVLGCVAVTFGTWITGHADRVARLLAPVAVRLRGVGGALPVALLVALALLLPMALAPLDRKTSWPYVGWAKETRFYLFVPAPLPRADVVTARARGFTFSQPVHGDQCWAAAQPCTPEDASTLALRDPALGVGGGFISPRGAGDVGSGR